ncbi:MAG: hypothetical protein ACRENA_07130 [Vulcanimicrobiaceae bacterium]
MVRMARRLAAPGAKLQVDPGIASPTLKLSVNVSEEVGLRLRQVAFEHRLSESSIVEVALGLLFRKSDGPSIGTVLRQHGATLRRKRQRARD